MFINDLWGNLRWEIESLLQFATNDAFCNINDKYEFVPEAGLTREGGTSRTEGKDRLAVWMEKAGNSTVLRPDRLFGSIPDDVVLL